MRFVILGSGTGYPDPDRGPAGFLLQVGDRSFLIDGGSGTLGRCARAGVDPRALAGGIYSHRHPDHTGDLVPLLFAMRLPPARPAPYPIWAGAGFASYLTALRGVYGHWIDVETPVTELPLDGESTTDLGGAVLRARPAAHSAGALHLRFDAPGGSVVFSGDTGPSDALVALARGADLLVCECGSPEEAPIPGHLRPSDVAWVAREARPREVWITHVPPGADPRAPVEAVARVGVGARRARDGDVWTGGSSGA